MKVLKLDLDGKNGFTDFLDRLWLLRGFGLAPKKVLVYHTENGYHVRMYCDNNIDDKTACFMQLALGSDYRREVFNWLRIERGCKNWNLLFGRKEIVNKVGQIVEVSKEQYDKELSQKIMRIIKPGGVIH
jgi:DNA primase catalytic subunit